MNLFILLLWILSTTVIALIKVIGAAAFSWWWAGLPTAIMLLIWMLSKSDGNYLDGLLDGLFISSIFDDWDD